MRRHVRHLLILFLLLFGILAAIVAAFAFHGDRLLRHAAERALQAWLVPAVTVAGPVEWRLRPTPRFALHGLRLRGEADENLLVMERIVVHLDAEDLFERRPIASAIELNGVELNLRRETDGSIDARHWLRPRPSAEPPASAAWGVTGEIRVDDARVRIAMPEGVVVVDALWLRAGPVALDAPFPVRLGAKVGLTGSVPRNAALEFSATLGLVTEAVRLDEVLLRASGKFGGWTLEDGRIEVPSLQLATSGRAHLEAPRVELSGTGADGRFDLRVEAAVIGREGIEWSADDVRVAGQAGLTDLAAGGRVSAAHVRFHRDEWWLDQARADLELASGQGEVGLVLDGDLAGRFADADRTVTAGLRRSTATLPHPSGAGEPLVVEFAGSARFDPVTGQAAAELSGGFDASRFDGRMSRDPAARPPWSVALALDRLDLDRYAPPQAGDTGAADLAIWRSWRSWPVEGELRVGELKMRGLLSRDARLVLGH